MRDEWQILGIEPTDNKRAIKKAYAAKLAQFHPEEYPEEFQEIQQAYTTIMDAFARKYTQVSTVDSTLKAAFQQKDNIYTIDTSTVFNNNVVSPSTKEKKKDDESLYNDINLDYSFHDFDRAKNNSNHIDSTYDFSYDNDPNIIPDPTTNDVYPELSGLEQQPLHKLEDDESITRDLSNLYIQKFRERLRQDLSLYTLKCLILNEAFFQQMHDPYFYEKISIIIYNQLSSFNAVSLSFLFDTFTAIRNSYQYSISTYDVPSCIQALQEEEKRRLKRKRIFRSIGVAIFLICFYSICLLMISENKKQEVKKEELIENIRKDKEENIEDLVKKNELLDIDEINANLNKELKEKYSVTYTCKVTGSYVNSNLSNLYSCKTKDATYYGHVTFEIDASIKSITEPTLLTDK